MKDLFGISLVIILIFLIHSYKKENDKSIIDADSNVYNTKNTDKLYPIGWHAPSDAEWIYI
jgi:hypothetical protein